MGEILRIRMDKKDYDREKELKFKSNGRMFKDIITVIEKYGYDISDIQICFVDEM